MFDSQNKFTQAPEMTLLGRVGNGLRTFFDFSNPLRWFDWATIIFVAAAMGLTFYGVYDIIHDSWSLPTFSLGASDSSERAR
jgi:hypothetical protein